jgi:hypothetical protein
LADRDRAFNASVSRFRGGAVVTKDSSKCPAACVTSFTARLKAASFACDGLGETAQFSNELQRRRANLVVRRGRRKIMQGLDVSAHAKSCTADYADQDGFILSTDCVVDFCCVWRGKHRLTCYFAM